jgi:hypothetical protein
MSKARNLAAFVFLTALAAFGQGSGTAQPSLWRGLQTGPYPVGFKSQWTWDGTRTFLPPTDWHGHALHRQTARPIRLSVWYPAVSQKTARPMLYEGYFQADHEPSELRELAQTIDAYDRRSNTNMFSGD